jgi:hypothetical protein
VLGVVLQLAWPRGADKPELGNEAAIFGAAIVAGGIFALLLVPHATAAAASAPSVLMPEEDEPELGTVTSDRARQLVERYPHDPRAHLVRGYAFLHDDRDLADAEEQFRQALSPADLAAAGLDPAFEKTVRVLLALTVAYEHRPEEARAIGGPYCDFAADRLPEIAEDLRKQGVCE